MKRLFPAVVVLTIAGASAHVHAQNQIDILQIWQNFIASGVAATECGSAEPASRQKFLSNLTAVSIRATQELEQRQPSAAPAAIENEMKLVGDGIHNKVEAEIKQNGCSSPKIQPLISMYKMHSEMSF